MFVWSYTGRNLLRGTFLYSLLMSSYLVNPFRLVTAFCDLVHVYVLRASSARTAHHVLQVLAKLENQASENWQIIMTCSAKDSTHGWNPDLCFSLLEIPDTRRERAKYNDLTGRQLYPSWERAVLQ